MTSGTAKSHDRAYSVQGDSGPGPVQRPLPDSVEVGIGPDTAGARPGRIVTGITGMMNQP